MNYLKYIIIAVSCMVLSCASKKTVKVTENYPNKALKTYQKVSTYQVCRENCRIVKTKKTREEYYNTGKLMSLEKTLTETTLDGQLRTAKNFSKFYDENGKLIKKIDRNEFSGTTYIYNNGKLITKTSFDQ